MREESREYGLKNGQSPMADKVVLIDFDGTIFPFGELWSMDPPIAGAKKVIDWLRGHCYRVRVFSSRMSLTWLNEEGEQCAEHLHYMLKRLKKYGICHDGIALDKEPAAFYVDDKAIAFTGDWELVLDQIKWQETAKQFGLLEKRNGR